MPKKKKAPFNGDINSFLASRPKMRANFANMSQADQQGFINNLQAGGGKAARQYAQNVRQRSPLPGQGGGSVVPGEQGNYDLQDTAGMINNQQLFNQQTALFNEGANSINQQGPFGGVEYVIGPDGKRTAKYTMEGGMQGLYDQVRQQGGLKFGDAAPKAWENTFNPNAQGAPAAPWQQDYGQQRASAEQAVMDKFSRNQEPLFQNELENFRQRMSNEGISEDSDRYKRMENEIVKRQEGLRSDARAEALQQGRAEQAQGFGQGVQSRNLYGQEQGQQFNQQMQGRQQYTGEQAQEWGSPLTALQGLTNVQQGFMGSYQPAGAVNMANTNVTDPALQMYQMGPYAQQQFGNQMRLQQLQGQQQLEQIKAGAIMGAGMYGAPPNY